MLCAAQPPGRPPPRKEGKEGLTRIVPHAAGRRVDSSRGLRRGGGSRDSRRQRCRLRAGGTPDTANAPAHAVAGLDAEGGQGGGGSAAPSCHRRRRRRRHTNGARSWTTALPPCSSCRHHLRLQVGERGSRRRHRHSQADCRSPWASRIVQEAPAGAAAGGARGVPLLRGGAAVYVAAPDAVASRRLFAARATAGATQGARRSALVAGLADDATDAGGGNCGCGGCESGCGCCCAAHFAAMS